MLKLVICFSCPFLRCSLEDVVESIIKFYLNTFYLQPYHEDKCLSLGAAQFVRILKLHRQTDYLRPVVWPHN